MEPFWLCLPGFFIWLAILLLPWRPWSTRESLDADKSANADLSRLTVLIPARNEEEVILTTLAALAREDSALQVIVIDDQSTDQTVAQANKAGLRNLIIINGAPLPEGWTGKLWALEQGSRNVDTPYVLLLDADIELQAGTIATLLNKMDSDDVQLVSLMAFLKMKSLWEKLLMPAFIYFFKLLYPFHISNSKSGLVAAAAGGCILIKVSALSEIGGFATLKNNIIDDCALARAVKNNGMRTWIGLTHSAVSNRHYNYFQPIRDMVARTAYTQLHYSLLLLVLCTVIMVFAFLMPLCSLLLGDANVIIISILSIMLMICSFIPTLKYYDISLLWVFTLPIAGLLYLMMTWYSAIRHWQGIGAQWKNRTYSNQTGRQKLFNCKLSND